MINVFEPLGADDCGAINDYAHTVFMPKTDLDEFVSYTQLRYITVQRWFGNVTTNQDLVKNNATGMLPAFFMGSGFGDIVRLFSGMLLFDDLYAPRLNNLGLQSDGKEREFRGDDGENEFATLAEAGARAWEIATIKYDKFLGNMWEKMTLETSENGLYLLRVFYRDLGSYEGSEKLVERSNERFDFIEELGDF